MLPSSAPLNVPEIPKVVPKDTAGAYCVKPPPVPSHREMLGVGALACLSLAFPSPFPCLSLAIAPKTLISRAIRGSRPGAERTVSAISPFGRCWCGRASRSVVPCFRLLSISSPFRRVRRACRREPRQHKERTSMPLYEHVFLARQDASTQQVEELTTQMTGIVEQLGGKVVKMENWGVRSLTYRMNKNRKAHFVLLNIDAPSAAISEIERQERISEDVIRYL